MEIISGVDIDIFVVIDTYIRISNEEPHFSEDVLTRGHLLARMLIKVILLCTARCSLGNIFG